MKKLRLMVVTTSRADYGLLYPLIKKIREDESLELKLVVTGSHLSERHGNTIDYIKKDGIDIAWVVGMTQESDTERDTCYSISKGITGFSDAIENITPDLVIVLGDRYELWAVCMAAIIHRTPIAHIHGGEITFGAMDESIRHSITKMSSLHFASIEPYSKRIIQMGEHPDRVFTVGALGIDNIMNMELMEKEELSKYTGVDFFKDIALMTYHPVTLDDYHEASNQIKEIFEALLETDLITLITMPNADAGGLLIYESIKKYSIDYPLKFKIVKNLGQKAYLSAMKNSRLMIGNSSSGVIESASYKLPVVNIGDRQAGRFKPLNVIDCTCMKDDIADSIRKALSQDFLTSLAGLENPYGQGNTADRIVSIIKSMDLKNKTELIKKQFYDLNFNDISEGKPPIF